MSTKESLNKLFGFFGTIKGLEYLIIVYMFASVFGSYMSQMAKGREKVLEMGVAGILGTIAAVALNIYLLLYLKLGFIGFFWASILSSAVQIIYYVIKLKLWQLIKFNIVTKRLAKEMVFYSFPVILTSLGWMVNHAADKYVVTMFCGVAMNGLLAVSYKIPTIINVIQQIFIQAWQISAIKEYENGDSFYKQMFEYYNLLMCVSCSVIIMMTRPLATFLFAKDFYIAWQYVPLLLVCSVLNGAAGFIGPILSARKDSKTLAKSAVWSSISNIFLNLLLTYYFGVQGAVIATVISSYVMYIYRKRVIGDKIESNLYKTIMFVWVLLIAQSFAEIYYQNYYIQLAVFAFILFLMNKPIINCLSKAKNYLIKKANKIQNDGL